MKITQALIFSLFFVPTILFAAPLELQVTGVHDGDTLAATDLQTAKRYKVRLMGVDTPEVDFYENTQGDASLKARDYLRSLVPVGSNITLSDDSQIDKHGRVLGRILKNGIDINKEMLKQGWGVIYFIYPFDKRLAADYSKSAKEAFENKRGIFSVEFADTEVPYQFRLRVRDEVGRNPVGDLELKKIMSPEDVEKIPVWRRVFFPDFDLAYKNGYN